MEELIQELKRILSRYVTSEQVVEIIDDLQNKRMFRCDYCGCPNIRIIDVLEIQDNDSE